MPDQEWFKKQGPDGQWYKTQAASSEDAVNKFQSKWYPEAAASQQATGSITAAPTGAGAWLEQAKADVEHGTGGTWLGRGLAAMGAKGLSRGVPEEVGNVIGGPIVGPLEMGHGATQFSSHPMRGTMEMAGGLYHTTALAAVATQPEFLPSVMKFSAIQSGAEKIGKNLGLQPETNQFVSMILAVAGTGATLDPRARLAAIDAEMRALKASRGFGSETNPDAIQRAAEENVTKAEAQANTIKDIAKRSGQTVAQVLQSGAASTAMRQRDEQLPLKFGEHAKATPPETKVETPAETISKQRTAEGLAATRPATSVERLAEQTKTPPESFTRPRTIPRAKPGSTTIPERPASAIEQSRARTPQEQLFDRTRELRTAGLSDADQVFKLVKEFPDQKEAIANAYGIKTPSSSEVGRESAQGTTAKPPVQSISPTEATTRSGEPVRPAAKPEVSEPRYARNELTQGLYDYMKAENKGPALLKLAKEYKLQHPESTREDFNNWAAEQIGLGQAPKIEEKSPEVKGAELGQRAPQLPTDFAERIKIRDQRVADMQAKNPGVAKSEIQRRVAEQMDKERGSFSNRPLTEVEKRKRVQTSLKDSAIPNEDAWQDARNLISPEGKAFRIGNLDHDAFMQKHKKADFRSPYFEGGEGENGYIAKGWIRKAAIGEYAADLSRGKSIFSNLSRAIEADLKNGQQYFRIDNGPKTYEFSAGDYLSYKGNLRNMLGDFRRTSTGLFALKGTFQSERGSFGGGSERDPQQIRFERNQKIDQWVKTLRDPKANPVDLDDAYKMLKAYGLEHEEIAARVKGVPNDVQSLIRDTEALVEGRSVGRENISGVMHPDVEELDRMWRFGDERGSISFKPRKGAIVNPTPLLDSIQELTKQFEQVIRAEPYTDSTFKATEKAVNAWYKKTGADFHSDWSGLQMGLAKMTGHLKVFEAMRDKLLREPVPTDYRNAMGRFSGSLNRNNFVITDFIKQAKKFLPDEGARRAISHWIETSDIGAQKTFGFVQDQLLADRALRSKGKDRADYERARKLTPVEKQFAKMMVDHLDSGLKIAIDQGIMRQGIENYVPHIWERPTDQTKIMAYFSGLDRGGMLNPNFNAAKQRLLSSYFEGQQRGLKAKNTDILYLTASWDRALARALASRNFVADLSNCVKDGRPVIAPFGKGNPLYGSVSPEEMERPSAYFIRPKAGPEETGDYKVVDHPALTKWVWVTKDADGAPIYLKGDLRVHRDYAAELDNVINRGRWAAEHPAMTSLLKGGAFFKQSLLAGFPINPFHQIQEGLHAAFHKVNPFNPPKIELGNPSVSALLDHGLVIANTDPLASFDEGLSAGGIWGKIPGLKQTFGRINQKYTEYLFQDYIPRLKTKMAVDALERNMHRFQSDIDDGRMTSDMVTELTANQANAAFGELNYMMLGRHPGTQAAMRMMLFAPDFFEARARFVGQAMRPYGREQQAALLRGAAGLYIATRILNKLLDGDYHWKEEPFSVIVNGYRYTQRSLPEDILRATTDFGKFTTDRENPILVGAYHFMAGTDDFGRKRDMGERTINLANKLMVPFQTEGFVNKWLHNNNRDIAGGLVQSLAITKAIHRTEAGSLAHQYAMDTFPDTTSHHIMETARDMRAGTFTIGRAQDLIREKKMLPADIEAAQKIAQLPEFYLDYRKLPNEQKAKVWVAATPSERRMLAYYAGKEPDLSTLLPEQRAAFMREFADQ